MGLQSLLVFIAMFADVVVTVMTITNVILVDMMVYFA